MPRATDKEESPRLLVLLLHPGSKSRMAYLDLFRLSGHMVVSGRSEWQGMVDGGPDHPSLWTLHRLLGRQQFL